MKILHIHDKEHPHGGVQAYLRNLRAAQARVGHHPVMLRLLKGAAAGAEGKDELIGGTAVAPFGVGAPGRKLLNLVRAENPDVVHVHSVFTRLGPGVLDALRHLKPTVYTMHDIRPLFAWGLQDRALRDSPELARWIRGSIEAERPSRWLKRCLLAPSRRLLLTVYRRLDRMIVANALFRDELQRRGFANGRVALIPLFVAPSPPSSDPSASDPIVLFVGRLSEEKGILPFIRMLRLLRGEAWRALVVGDGPLRGEAGRLVASLSLEPRVRFVDSVPSAELGRIYASCRLLVVPSLIPENFALVGVEAMAAGRPVVGFRQAGITEWLRDGVDGFLVAAGDLGALADRTQALLDSPELARRLGRAGQAIAREEFAPERHLALLDAVYEQVVRRPA